MRKFSLSCIFIVYALMGIAQQNIPLTQLTGQYRFDGGMIIQFTVKQNKLFLITPGNPLQEMDAMGKNKYRSTTLKGDLFSFETGENKVITLTIANDRGILKGTKTTDPVVDNSEVMDSIVTERRSSEHFECWFNASDEAHIDSLLLYLEKDYPRILKDFKLSTLPPTRVKIYHDLKTFHLSINQPDAPPQVMDTAFGKDEFRMVSPSQAGAEILPFISHEFIHCVHLNIDYSPNNPRWLWEGVAMYESGWFMDPKETDIIKNKQYPSLNSLSNGMEYSLGYVIIEAIKDLWNFDTVIGLIKHRGNVEKTVQLTQAEFDKKVFDQIYNKYSGTK